MPKRMFVSPSITETMDYQLCLRIHTTIRTVQSLVLDKNIHSNNYCERISSPLFRPLFLCYYEQRSSLYNYAVCQGYTANEKRKRRRLMKVSLKDTKIHI